MSTTLATQKLVEITTIILFLSQMAILEASMRISPRKGMIETYTRRTIKSEEPARAR
jgi:hypothetical protein